jgi:hypothetical protein
MAMATAILLGVAAYCCVAVPVAVVIGRMLAGPPAAGLAGDAGAAAGHDLGAERPAGARVATAHVAAGRTFALVAGHPHPAGYLQKARAEAHPAQS